MTARRPEKGLVVNVQRAAGLVGHTGPPPEPFEGKRTRLRRGLRPPGAPVPLDVGGQAARTKDGRGSMLRKTTPLMQRRRALAAAVSAVTAATLGLAGTAPATAGQAAWVDCWKNPAALRLAIDSATAGETLKVSGTCTGPFVITRNLNLIGADKAVLDGNFAGSTVSVGGAGVRVRLHDLTIINGTGNVVNNQNLGGGILNNAGSTVEVTGTELRNNAAQFGGGIANLSVAGGAVTLDHSVLRDNTASVSGGAVFVGQQGTFSAIHSLLRDNTAQHGGGILADLGGRVTLSDSAVRDNSVSMNGGGLNMLGGSTLVLIRSEVEGNRASDGPGSGGGILNVGATVTLNDSHVRENHPDNCAPPGSVLGCLG
ncbi:hypothetical protein ACGFMM_05990 [Streptomyces sp. NPDC048604]|uniref:hypothetical protein n=1 Tax=Streptomyces sp. NPDC048604 TaxID=3365578 RepID=UPI00371C19C0